MKASSQTTALKTPPFTVWWAAKMFPPDKVCDGRTAFYESQGMMLQLQFVCSLFRLQIWSWGREKQQDAHRINFPLNSVSAAEFESGCLGWCTDAAALCCSSSTDYLIQVCKRDFNRKPNFFLRTFFSLRLNRKKKTETTLGVINGTVPYFLHWRVLLEMCQRPTNWGDVNSFWRG